MKPVAFDYARPASVAEALGMLAASPDAKVLAGGQTLGPMLNLRLAQPALLVDITRIPELAAVSEDAEGVTIGATVTHAAVEDGRVPDPTGGFLRQVARGIAYRAVRTRGTIGGSLAHADPAADLPVILAALNAAFVLQSSAGTRTLQADEFITDFYTTAMNAGEVLTEVRIPLPAPRSGTAYAKLPHPASGYVVVSAGALITRQASGTCVAARVFMGGLGSGPRRAVSAETELQGKALTPQTIAAAAAKAAAESDPMEDSYADAEYKRHVATVYARKAIEAAVERARN
jgi:CO/xanthine dehydrogenase FAD-binding subunit